MDKIKLKRMLKTLGIAVVGNYVRKKDIEKIIAGPVIDIKTKKEIPVKEVKEKRKTNYNKMLMDFIIDVILGAGDDSLNQDWLNTFCIENKITENELPYVMKEIPKLDLQSIKDKYGKAIKIEELRLPVVDLLLSSRKITIDATIYKSGEEWIIKEFKKTYSNFKTFYKDLKNIVPKNLDLKDYSLEGGSLYMSFKGSDKDCEIEGNFSPPFVSDDEIGPLFNYSLVDILDNIPFRNYVGWMPTKTNLTSYGESN